MAVNWFEGGRRIRDLICGVVAIGGLIYVWNAGTEKVTLASYGPGTEWRLEAEPCGYSDAEEPIRLNNVKVNFKMVACLRANDQGQVPYAIAPTPKDAPPGGGAWYFNDSAYSQPVRDYITSLRGKLTISRTIVKASKRQHRDNNRAAYWEAIKQTIGVVGGIVFGLWLVSAAVGWIIRGFAGIPNGQDFRVL
jgi:hypothetical protein